MQKNILAIHDISCFGKCSLTVALPILSACGHTTTVLPTAVLSTHTGGFTNYTFNDLTTDLLPIINHWKSLNIKFDAIYTGYLGSIKQIDMVKQIIDTFKTPTTQIIVDPVMGDGGKLYSGFDTAFAQELATLTKKADIIIPNLTEASLILNIDYPTAPNEEYYIDVLNKLHIYSNASVILTGVAKDNLLGAGIYDANTQTTSFVYADKINGFYHGTGDVFASVLTGSLLLDETIISSTQIACDITKSAIEKTYHYKTDQRFGVAFEQCMPMLMQKLKLI